jgi:hypothetical protein
VADVGVVITEQGVVQEWVEEATSAVEGADALDAEEEAVPVLPRVVSP